MNDQSKPETAVTFTVVDPLPRNGANTPVGIVKDTNDNYDIQIGNHEPLTIDRQQMYELGLLLVAMAGKEVEVDAAFILIDEFGYNPKSIINRLYKEAKDWD